MYSYTATYVSAFVQRCEANMTLQINADKKKKTPVPSSTLVSSRICICPLLRKCSLRTTLVSSYPEQKEDWVVWWRCIVRGKKLVGALK